MGDYKQYIVNSFAEKGYRGNPAAVCIIGEGEELDLQKNKVLSAMQMQKIASANNLSETAFCCCTHRDEYNPTFKIRWFTPGCEVSLCGHATLASADILFAHYFKQAHSLLFESLSGELRVFRTEEGIIMMDFPKYDLEPVTEKKEYEAVIKALDLEENINIDIYKGIDYVAVFEKAEDIINFKPNFEKIAALPGVRNLLITACATSCTQTSPTLSDNVQDYDFVSRCFFPKEAINEDPVTGSAHCTLAPFWAERLNKNNLTAYQASSRGGILHLTVLPSRVLVGGRSAVVTVCV